MKAIVLLTILNFTVLTGASHTLGLYLNTSPSYPVGVYRVLGTDYQRGDLVAFCVGDRYVNYLVSRGSIVRQGACHGTHPPLIKKIFATIGDAVLFGQSVSVNGQAIPNTEVSTVIEQSLRDIPSGTYIMQAGEYLLLSDYNKRSFDSRYFGPIARSDIRHRVAPVWVL